MGNGNSDYGFILGVTGHRDASVAKKEELEEHIDDLLEELQVALGTFPLTVACGLADGADRLVAGRALAKGISVLAVLPMPREHYINDFSAQSVQEFESLLANKDVSVIELPLPENVSLNEFREAGPIRDQSYAYLRDWLVRRSNLILGLWDGEVDRPKGGTTDVLLSYLYEQESPGGFEDIPSLAFKDSGPAPYGANLVAWIETGRSDADNLNPSLSYLSPSLEKSVLIRTREMPGSLSQRLLGLREHSDALLNLRERNTNDYGYSLFEESPENLPSPLRASLMEINTEFMDVDTLAIEEQRRSGWLFKSFGLLAATMGFLFLLYAKLIPAISIVIVYLALFATAFALFGKVGKKISFTRYLVHRVIAESLRIRFYMMLAGVENDNKLAQLRHLSGIESISGFIWLNDILKTSQSIGIPQLRPTRATLLTVKSSWIDAQLSYFANLVNNLSEKTKRLGQVKILLMCMNLSLLTILIVFGDRLALIFFAETLTLKSFLIFIIGLIPLWVGIWELYQNKMATRELLWQYKNQAEYFQQASTRMEGDLPNETMQNIIADLGERSLFETYQWTIRRYHREAEPSPTLFGTTGMAMFQGRVAAGRAKKARTVKTDE